MRARVRACVYVSPPSSSHPRAEGAHGRRRRGMRRPVGGACVFFFLLGCVLNAWLSASPVLVARLARACEGSRRTDAMEYVTRAIESAQARVATTAAATTAASEAIDRTTSDAAFAVAKTIEVARERVNEASGTAQAHAGVLVENVREREDAFFKRVSKEVADVARANPASAGAGALGLALILLPGPRALLWRVTMGRLQSEEAIFNACVRKSEMLALDAERASGEIQKLAAAAVEAEVEMKRGAANLRAAARELRSIESRTYAMDNKATGLLNDLRVLPSKEAVALREDVAVTVDKVAVHRNAALATLKKIFKSGIEV